MEDKTDLLELIIDEEDESGVDYIALVDSPAILSNWQSFSKDKLKQSRIISAEVEYKKKNIQLINIYTPNGNPVDTEQTLTGESLHAETAVSIRL